MRILGSMLCLVALGLAGCGGSDRNDETPPPVNSPTPPASTSVPAGQQATQSVGAAGGTVTLNSSDGSRFELVVPAGALPVSTSLTMRTDTATQAQRFVLRFEPAGLMFANGLQGTLTITLPSSLALSNTGALVYDGVPLATTRLNDGRLQVNLASFVDTSVTPQSSGRAQALSVNKSVKATSINTCGNVPQVGDFEEGGLTATDLATIEMYGHCMVGAVQQLANAGDYEAAISAATATAALLQAVGQQGNTGASAAASFIQQASTFACNELRAELNDVIVAQVTSMGMLNDLIKPILFWQQLVDQLGASCNNVGATEYITVIEAKTDQAVAYYASARSGITNTTGQNYTAAVNEAQESRQTLNEVRALQPNTAMQNVLTTQIEQRAQTALLEAMLHAPFMACRDNGDYAELIRLMDIFGNPASVRNAAQYCGTTLAAESFDANQASIATLTPAIGGRINGQTIEVASSGTINVTRDGRITLNGPIRALGCPATQTGGTESLEVRFNNVVVQTIASAPYLSSNLQLNMSQLLGAANIDPEDFSSGTLTLVRAGSPCNDFWGAHPQPLLTLTLSLGVCEPESGHAFCVTPLTVGGNQLVQGYAVAISRTGRVIVVGDARGHWHQGVMTAFPTNFQPYDTHIIPASIADDGAIPGVVYTDVSNSNCRFNPVVFKPASNTLTQLLQQPMQCYEPLDDSVYGPNARAQGNSISGITISPAGRVTFSIWSHAHNVETDLGFCEERYSDGRFDCTRNVVRQALGPNYTQVSTVRSDGLDATNTSYLTLFDGDALGRYGASTYLTSLPNADQTAIDFRIDPMEYGYYVVAYSAGGVYISGNPPEMELPPTAITPAGWDVVNVGPSSHAVACNGARNAFRVVRLTDGTATESQSTQFEVTRLGHRIEVNVDCSLSSRRLLDAEGRLSTSGWIESLGDVPLILTPAGVSLP